MWFYQHFNQFANSLVDMKGKDYYFEKISKSDITRQKVAGFQK
jgi:hypothetical protein